jgi:hypothetical protein
MAKLSDLTPEGRAALARGAARLAGYRKRIHVNKHVIASNTKTGADEPAITIQTSHGPVRAREVSWNGPSVMVQSMSDPLACGAKIWIETDCALDWKL